MAVGNQENVIEWITGEDTISVTLTQQRFITKVKKLCKEHPDLCSISAENSDGSIFAHLPLKSLKLSLISLSVIEKEKRKKRMADIRKEKNGKTEAED